MKKEPNKHWIGWLVASPFLLFVLLSILIYLPPVQQFLVDKAADYASKETGFSISVKKVSLSFPLDLVIGDVLATTETQDTLLNVEQLKVEIQLLPLLNKQVEVDGVWLEGVKVKSGSMIPGLQLDGELGTFFMASHGVSFEPNLAVINKVLLEDTNLDITLDSQEEADTTVSEPLYWKFLLEEMQTRNVSVRLHMPADTLHMQATLPDASLENAWLNLHDMACFLQSLKIEDGSLAYCMSDSLRLQEGAAPAVAGLNPSNLKVSALHLQVDSVYWCGCEMRAKLNEFSFKEQSGLELKEAALELLSDSQTIYLPRFYVHTPHSTATLKATLDWSLLDDLHRGNLEAQMDLSIGKNDVCQAMGWSQQPLEKIYPDKPFIFHLKTDGDTDYLQVKQCALNWQDVLQLDVVGSLHHLTDSIRRGGAVRLETEAKDFSFLSAWQPQWRVAAGTRLEGLLSMEGTKMMADLLLKQPQANAKSEIDSLVQHVSNDSLSIQEAFKMSHAARLLARYDEQTDAYTADLVMNHLDMHQFMPQDSLFEVSASLKAEGEGFDFFSPSTQLSTEMQIDGVHYGSYHLSGYQLLATLKDHSVNASWKADNAAMHLQGKVDGVLKANDVRMNLQMEVPQLDWQAMNLSKVKLVSRHQLNVSMHSNLLNTHRMDVELLKTSVKAGKETFKTRDLFMGLDTQKDTTIAYIRSGDLDVKLTSKNNLDTYLSQVTRFVDLLAKQWESKTIVQYQLKEHLPEMLFDVRSGKDNFLARAVKLYGMEYDKLYMSLNTSPGKGIYGRSYLHGMQMDSLALDTLYLNLNQDSLGVNMRSGIRNGMKQRQEPFEIKLDGYFRDGKAQLLLQFLNAQKEKGVYLGMNASLYRRGIGLRLFPEHPTLTYRPFTLNEDNYFYVADKGRMFSNIHLYEENGSGLSLYSTNADSLAQQDITLELQRINLQEFKLVLPYLPDVKGWLSGAVHYVDMQNQSQINTELQLEDFTYEGNSLGNWDMNGVYLPDSDYNHLVDGFILHEGSEIIQLSGSYQPEDKANHLAEKLKADVRLSGFPLSVLNPFFPDQMVEMNGKVDGELVMTGSTGSPVLNGKLAMNDVSMALPDLSVKFLFDKKHVQMKDSRLLFDKYHIYTKGKSPFTVNGKVDFSNLDQMMVDLKLKARDYELMNAPKSRRAVTYGKIYVDVDAALSGPMDELKMRGNMNLLGKTDFTYVLKESPLAVNDRLGEMVTFVNFKDTATVQGPKEETVALTGMDIAMTIHIDQAVQAHVDLTSDGSNYMLLEGGGDLFFQYTPQGEMLLNGRYSFMSGELKYQIPIIPLKTFAIKNGSYMNWTGNAMNPELNIKATERIRTLVGSKDQNPRMVGFDVGLKLTDRLENLGLAFTLEAPEDTSVQEQLSAMSAEERGKLAITMLVTGVYMAEGNETGGFNMNNALNTFLQQQISDIVGKSVDISVGMETMDNLETGGRQTDYNFQFAKRFWNNRFRIVIGGTVSTGNTVQKEETFIDNISIEYRLDNSGTRYVKLFHDKNYESILEGEVVETGIGVVLRKKVSNLGDLFVFKRKKDEE